MVAILAVERRVVVFREPHSPARRVEPGAVEYLLQVPRGRLAIRAVREGTRAQSWRRGRRGPDAGQQYDRRGDRVKARYGAVVARRVRHARSFDNGAREASCVDKRRDVLDG